MSELEELNSEEEVDLHEWKGFFSVNEIDNLMAEIDTAPVILPYHHHACLLASGTLLQIHIALQGVFKELAYVTNTHRPLTQELDICSKPDSVGMDIKSPKKELKIHLEKIRNTIIGSIYILDDVGFILPPDGEEPIKVGNGDGKYVFVFQMLIGEKNLECGFPAGLTYGILGHPGMDESGNLKVNKLKGNSMMGAGYLLLSTNTIFVCSYEHRLGTHEYIWDKSIAEFLTSNCDLSIPENGKIYCVDHSKTIGWDNATKTLLTNMINPRLGREGRHYYVDCSVAENHAVIREGGIYLSPITAFHPNGKDDAGGSDKMKFALTITVLFSNFLLLAYCDNLELLSGTLRKFERTSCDEHGLSLACPQGTTISLESAKYATDRKAAQLCPEAGNAIEEPASCQLPSSLQYSLLQTVVEGCHKKRNCKIQASPKLFGADPCPGLPKYVTILYKCTPYEFRSKVACENEIVNLKCNPNSRIAIYSASYGRTQYESVQCPQPQGVPEETCLGSYATETVVQICHGKRRCTLSVDSTTFGSPCRKESRMYLKVVYTCVPRRVLRPEFEERQETDELSDTVDEAVDYEEEGMAAPNTSGHLNSSAAINESVTSHHNKDGVVPTYWPKEGEKTSDNLERLTLYVAVSAGGGFVCLLIVLAGKLAWSRRPKPPEPPAQGEATELPPFTEDLSEAEIDLTIGTPVALHPGEVVRYGGGSGMDAPRSLSRSANSQYYYG